VTFFPPRPAVAFLYRTLGGLWGQRAFSAKNPPFGAYLDYYMKEDTGEEVSLAIADSAGQTVRTLKGSGSPGLHRVVWDLQRDPKERIPDPEWNDEPQFVPPGSYTVTLTYGKRPPAKQPLEVRWAEGLEAPGS
jgi:hypothetical protein